MFRHRIGRWIALIAAIVAALGAVPAYFVFWDRPDLDYQVSVVSVPVPETLPGRLPNYLALVTVQNIGRRPSEHVEGNIAGSGELLYFEIGQPNPAYGQVEHRMEGQRLFFSSPRLAPGEYPVKFSIWYKGNNAPPEIAIADERGAARGVVSIAAEKGGLRKTATFLLGIITGIVTGGLVSIIWNVISRLSRKGNGLVSKLGDK